MHSSQNEQDSHNYAAFAHVPMLDPSDSSEALAFAREAFVISERFDVPVLIRSTVRVSHSKSLVQTGSRAVPERPAAYRTDAAKWVMMPAMAKRRRVDLDRRLSELAAFAEDTQLNRVEVRDRTIGVVCAGAVYQHVREALPEASTFKLGLTFPLPSKRLAEFAEAVDSLYVVEEADAYLARSLRSLGVLARELPLLPVAGELSPGLIRMAFELPAPELREADTTLPARPPLMCPGCPHRLVFSALRKIRAVVTGDIGCYTLGALPPLSAMDTCVDMGASIGMAHGAEIAGGVAKRPVVAVIGDSTFAHSGITGLMDITYNGGGGTVAILDNRITAMTGHQGNPIDGLTLQPRPSHEVDLVALVEALGVSRVRVADAQDLAAVESALKEETASPELSVVIFRSPCALLERSTADPFAVDEHACTMCGICVRLGCPAIGKDELTGKAEIDTSICVGCGQCVQVCRYEAIVRSGPSCDFKGADAR
jgi:indolepyruvate ferredoxin oxidoreductase alpha subunit